MRSWDHSRAIYTIHCTDSAPPPPPLFRVPSAPRLQVTGQTRLCLQRGEGCRVLVIFGQLRVAGLRIRCAEEAVLTTHLQHPHACVCGLGARSRFQSARLWTLPSRQYRSFLLTRWQKCQVRDAKQKIDEAAPIADVQPSTACIPAWSSLLPVTSKMHPPVSTLPAQENMYQVRGVYTCACPGGQLIPIHLQPLIYPQHRTAIAVDIKPSNKLPTTDIVPPARMLIPHSFALGHPM